MHTDVFAESPLQGNSAMGRVSFGRERAVGKGGGIGTAPCDHGPWDSNALTWPRCTSGT